MSSLLAPSSLFVRPDDAAYDEARAAWNLALDQRPALVALPQTADDVIAVVRHARERGLRVAAQATGHGAGALGPLDDTILIKTHRMRGVTIDAEHRIARVEAGAQWQDVVPAAAEHGLACLHGSAPDVGVVGYTLGGGLSFYGRRYGTAASRVLGFDVVTADGEPVRADRRENPELFRALCGGGGSFGIVTAMEFELFDPGAIQAGHLWFPLERAAEVLKAWARWAPEQAEQVSSYARLLRVPDMPGAPEPIRGKSFAIVEAVILGDDDGVLAPLRELGPVMDTFSAKAPVELMDLHMDPPVPVPATADGWQLRAVTDATVDALVGGFTDGLLGLQLFYGGANVSSIVSAFTAFAVGVSPFPEAVVAVERDVDALIAATAEWGLDRDFANFSDRAKDPARLWEPGRHAELVAVKRAIDPDQVIVANHPVA